MTINTPFGEAATKQVEAAEECRRRFREFFYYVDGSGDVGPKPTPRRKLVEVVENGRRFYAMRET